MAAAGEKRAEPSPDTPAATNHNDFHYSSTRDDLSSNLARGPTWSSGGVPGGFAAARDPLHPGERVVRHFLPSLAADDRVVSATRELLKLDQGRRLPLVPLVVGTVERSRHEVILLAGDEEERRGRPLEADLPDRKEAAAGEP